MKTDRRCNDLSVAWTTCQPSVFLIQCSKLETSTEGWIVGLQPAALSLKGKEAARVETFIQSFGGSHRHITMDFIRSHS